MSLSIKADLKLIGLPVYIRKLDKLSSWGYDADPLAGRIDLVAASVFPVDSQQFSVFLIRSVDDLIKVVVGKNMSRERPNDQFDFVAFLPDEISQSGVAVDSTIKGETGCHAADRLHADLCATDHSAFTNMCRIALGRSRQALRVKKGEAKSMVAQLQQSGCELFPENSNCPCQVDVAPNSIHG